MAIRLYYIIF